ncbi:hypothetical protein V2J09_019276 [Rumex salicifolius]
MFFASRSSERTAINSKTMVLPILKLSILAFRSISKPFANKLKKQAGIHPKFRHFIIGLAQANHRLTTTIQRRIYGHATDVAIRPLNEERAVQAASELLGEFFLFAVAGAAIIFEVHRNAKKEEANKLKAEADRKKQEELVREVEFHKKRHELLAQEVELLHSKLDWSSDWFKVYTSYLRYIIVVHTL